MRAAGQDEDADRVSALPKPAVAVWAVNQLARTHQQDVAALAQAGEELVAAQGHALAGDERERFARARDAHGGAVRTARGLVAQLLEHAGRPATQATLERATSTLRSASLDAEARHQLVAGRLHDEVEAAGFSLFAGVELPRAAVPRESRDAELADLRRQLKEARSEARELRRRATKEARSAERLREEAEQAERDAAGAEADARRAEDAVEELERQARR